eukprot:4415722-Amphidinium_carterae.1
MPNSPRLCEITSLSDNGIRFFLTFMEEQDRRKHSRRVRKTKAIGISHPSSDLNRRCCSHSSYPSVRD